MEVVELPLRRLAYGEVLLEVRACSICGSDLEGFHDFKFNEKTIIGSQGMPEGYAPIFELVLAGRLPLSRLISHRLPLEQAERGLKLMDAKVENVMKVVLEPHGKC